MMNGLGLFMGFLRNQKKKKLRVYTVIRENKKRNPIYCQALEDNELPSLAGKPCRLQAASRLEIVEKNDELG